MQRGIPNRAISEKIILLSGSAHLELHFTKKKTENKMSSHSVTHRAPFRSSAAARSHLESSRTEAVPMKPRSRKTTNGRISAGKKRKRSEEMAKESNLLGEGDQRWRECGNASFSYRPTSEWLGDAVL